MNTNWRNTPGSKQHWLYRGRSFSGRILGMVYEVNPTAFTVYRENYPDPARWNTREFVTQVETLEEAQGLLFLPLG